MKAIEVFTPTGVPTVTYIDRGDQKLEEQLKKALEARGLIVSLSGPSKSGKTVLINRIVSPDNLIGISGAAIRNAEGLWDRILNWMDVPNATTAATGHTLGVEAGGSTSGKANIFFASGEAQATAGGSYQHDRSKQKTYSRGGIDQVIREIAGSEFVVFIDDFHYMQKETQIDVAKQIKEAAEKGVSICTASVPHRADDVVRSNPELRGRVKAIDFDYWKSTETAEIAARGFHELGIELDDKVIQAMASEAFGSPQLMQQICLQACFFLSIEDTAKPKKSMAVSGTDLRKIFEHAATTTDFSSLLDALHAGPKQRGTTRSQFTFTDGSKGDVYRCILLALCQDPPKLSFTYDDVYQRTRNVGQGEPPPGSSITQALEQIDRIADAIQPSAPVVEWSEDVLDIVDPYFLYYLRCSSRLETLQRK